MPKLEATFETLVDAFVFLDKNKDGYVSRSEMTQAVTESGEGSTGRIAIKRFGYFSLSLSLSLCMQKICTSIFYQKVFSCLHVIVKHYSQLLQLWPVSVKAVVVDMDMLVQDDLY